MNNFNKLIRCLVILLLGISVLSACGGGGGGGAGGNDKPPPASSNNWDSMVWDQDNWS